MLALYRPGDTIALNNMRAEALNFADFPFQFTDERDGLPICLNNGPAKSGTAYPGRAAPSPNYVTAGGNANALAAGGALRDVDTGSYTSNYGGYADFSHLARYWRAAFLVSGDASWLKDAAMFANITGLGYLPQTTAGGVTYYHNILVSGNQARGIGWALHALGDAVCALPPSDPMHQYLLDMLSDSAGAANALLTTGQAGTNAAKWGIVPQSTESYGSPAPWMTFIAMIPVVQEVWRGTVPGYATFWNGYFRNFHKLFNETYGGWGFAVAAYMVQVASSGNGAITFADLPNVYATIPQMLQAPNTDGGILAYSGSGGTLPVQPAASIGVCGTNTPSPTVLTSTNNWNSYACMALGVAAQMAAAGDVDGVAWFASIKARIGTSPFSWQNYNYGTPINAFTSFAFAI